jgi:hypothetical protein
VHHRCCSWEEAHIQNAEALLCGENDRLTRVELLTWAACASQLISGSAALVCSIFILLSSSR